MKRKGLYVLAMAAMLALAAGCGNNQEITEQSSNAVETEVETNVKENTSLQNPEEEKEKDKFAVMEMFEERT